TGPGGGGEQVDAGLGGGVVGPGAVDLEGQQGPDGRAGGGGGQVGPGDPEGFPGGRGGGRPGRAGGLRRCRGGSWSAGRPARAGGRARGPAGGRRVPGSGASWARSPPPRLPLKP